MRSEYGSDAVVEMLNSFGIEYVAFNPGASFRGLHESLVTAGDQGPAHRRAGPSSSGSRRSAAIWCGRPTGPGSA